MSIEKAKILKACVEKYMLTGISSQYGPAPLATQITKLFTLKFTKKATNYNLMSHIAIL